MAMQTYAGIDPTVFQTDPTAEPNGVVVDVVASVLAVGEDALAGQTLRRLGMTNDWRAGSAAFVLCGDGPVELRACAIETLVWALDADAELGFATAFIEVAYSGGDGREVIDVSQRGGLARWQQLSGGRWPVMLVRRELLEAAAGWPGERLMDCRVPRWKGIRVAGVLMSCQAKPSAGGTAPDPDMSNNGWHEAFPQPKPRAPFYRDLRWTAPAWNPLQRPDPAAVGGRRRVLQILPLLEMGGADKFALDVTEWLQRETGAHVSVVTTDPGGNRWLDRMRELTADVFELPTFLPEIEQPTFVSALIESRGIDTVMVTHSFAGYRMLPYLRARHPDVALVDYLHVEHDSWRSGGYPRSSVLYRDHLDFTITSSQHLRRWVEQRGHRADRISVCHTNIDAAAWVRDAGVAASVREQFGIGADQVLILFAARMVYQKQPKLLAAIMRRLEQEHAGLDFVCLAAGDGEDLPWLERFIDEHELRRLRLIGPQPNAEMKRLLAAADVYLLPSMMEGIALALFEAMAMGCVVVAGDVGGQSELVDADSGFLINRERGDELGQYVEVLRQVIADPGLRSGVQQRARQRIVDRFSIQHMARGLARAFDRAHELRRDQPNQVLPESVIRHLLAEAVELQRLDAEAASGDAGLKAKYEDRLEKRDHRIARLEAKLDKLRRQVESSRNSRKRSLSRRLKDSVRKRLGGPAEDAEG